MAYLAVLLLLLLPVYGQCAQTPNAQLEERLLVALVTMPDEVSSAMEKCTENLTNLEVASDAMFESIRRMGKGKPTQTPAIADLQRVKVHIMIWQSYLDQMAVSMSKVTAYSKQASLTADQRLAVAAWGLVFLKKIEDVSAIPKDVRAIMDRPQWKVLAKPKVY